MSETRVTFPALQDVMDGLDPQIVEQIGRQVQQDMNRLRDRLTKAVTLLDAGALVDFVLFGRHLHELRGLALTFGAADLTQVCLVAEEHARNRDRTGLLATIKIVLLETDRTSAALRAEFAGATK